MEVEAVENTKPILAESQPTLGIQVVTDIKNVEVLVCVDHLYYQNRAVTVSYDFPPKGEKMLLSFAVFQEMYAQQRKFYEVPWLVVLGPEEMFNLYPKLKTIKDIYYNVEDFVKNILDMPIDEMQKRIAEIPLDKLGLIRGRIQQYIDDNKIIDMYKRRELFWGLGIALPELVPDKDDNGKKSETKKIYDDILQARSRIIGR